MHLAVFVGPPRQAGEDDPPPPSSDLGARLSVGGYSIVHVPIDADLETRLPRAFAAAGPDDSLLIYMAGTLELDADRARMRLNGAGGPYLPLGAVGELVRSRRSRDTLLVLDVAHDEPGADALRASEYVQAAIDAFDPRKAGLEMLIAAGGVGAGGASWAFTRLLADALDDPMTRDARGATSATRVCALLRANGTLVDRVPSFAHVKGAREFLLLPPEAQPDTPSPPSSTVFGPPSVPRSVGALPPPSVSLEDLMKEIEAASAREEWEAAGEACKKALMLTPGDGARRVHVYQRYGDVKRRQGKPREAELNYEKALEIDRASAPAHEALIALADEARDPRRILALRRRSFEARKDPIELTRIAELLERDLADHAGAIAALEEARVLLPGDTDVLGRLRRLYEAKERWRKVLEVVGELAIAAKDPLERAALRFAQADVALGRLRDEERGLGWLEAGLDDDPAHEKALTALVAVRTRRKEWPSLDAVYARLIDRFAASGDVERAWSTCKRLGLLRRDAMDDPSRAIDAFRGAIQCKPVDVESRAALADLLAKGGDVDAAVAELCRMTRLEPLRVATYRKLYDHHARAGRTDRAWLAATALEELDAADIDHHLVVDQYRAGGMQVVSPKTVFGEHTWSERLRAEGVGGAVAEILRAVGRPAAALRVATLRREKKLMSLSPERRQSETSTASIVRTFVWASRVLDVALPELYVYDDVPGGLAAVPGDARATAIGPSVLTGLAVAELAFVVARHLTYYRPEHYALVFYPTLPELSQLFLSAVEVGLPDMPLSSRNGVHGKRLVEGIGKLLTDAERDELAGAATRFVEGGGRVDLAGFSRGVELTATRAGFALSGDLAVAMRVLRKEQRAVADVSLDDKRADLLAYSASDAFARLREELALTARAGAF